MFLRTGKIKQNPKVFLPSPEPALRPSVFNSPFPPLFGVLSSLSTYMGWGSGWVGALGVRGSLLLLGWGLLLPFFPPLPVSALGIATLHHCPAPTSPSRFPILHPKKVFVFLFLFCLLLVLFWF